LIFYLNFAFSSAAILATTAAPFMDRAAGYIEFNSCFFNAIGLGEM
jgi:hypothetical protein